MEFVITFHCPALRYPSLVNQIGFSIVPHVLAIKDEHFYILNEGLVLGSAYSGQIRASNILKAPQPVKSIPSDLCWRVIALDAK